MFFISFDRKKYANTEIHCVSSKFVHSRSIHYWFIDVAFVIFHFTLTLWALQALHKPMNEWMKKKTNKWMNFTWKTQVSFRHKSFGIDIKFTITENFNNNNKSNSNNQKTKWIISLHSTSSNKSMKCVIQPKALSKQISRTRIEEKWRGWPNERDKNTPNYSIIYEQDYIALWTYQIGRLIQR